MYVYFLITFLLLKIEYIIEILLLILNRSQVGEIVNLCLLNNSVLNN